VKRREDQTQISQHVNSQQKNPINELGLPLGALWQVITASLQVICCIAASLTGDKPSLHL
jgi:hypothetical protein